MRKFLFIFVFAILVLTACRAESNIVINIDEDGSATLSAEIGFDQEMLDLVAQGGDPEELLTQDLPPEAEGFETYSRVDGDMTYYGFSGTVDDLENNGILEIGDFAADFAEFSYTTDGNQATFAASIASADIGGELGDLPIDPTDITGDIFSANLILSMPGTVIEHNADEVLSDGSLVWNIPLTGVIDVFAVSETGSGPASWVWWVVIGVLAIGIIAGVAALIVSRKDSKKAVAAAAAAHTVSSSSTVPPSEPAAPVLAAGADLGTQAIEASGDPDKPALDPSGDPDKPALDASGDPDKPALAAADQAPALEPGAGDDASDEQDGKG
jgi:hypothetical protein